MNTLIFLSHQKEIQKFRMIWFLLVNSYSNNFHDIEIAQNGFNRTVIHYKLNIYWILALSPIQVAFNLIWWRARARARILTGP
jgi:hypothetical protein